MRSTMQVGQEELVGVAVGEIGLAVYPGQSPEEVLTLARLLENEADLGPYSARDVARKFLRELAVLRGEWPRDLEHVGDDRKEVVGQQ
jgi:hypothetical protein